MNSSENESTSTKPAIYLQVFHPQLSRYDRNETFGLANSAGYVIHSQIQQSLHKLNPNTLLGKGKVQQIRQSLQGFFDPTLNHDVWKDIDLYQDFLENSSEEMPLIEFNLPSDLAKPDDLTIIINNRLYHSQIMNLQGIWGTRVIDRDGLVLEIFEQNAQTRKSKLQIEKARLKLEANIVKTEYGLHLDEKQGRGFMGKGVAGWEPRMRAYRSRIRKIDEELEDITKHRQLQRRKRKSYFNLGIIGYTNAGKSTLLNWIAKANLKTANAEFTTVTTHARKVTFPKFDKYGNWCGEDVIVSDSVGFISDMSDVMLEAFLSTLEELTNSDLLVIVVDISEPEKYRIKLKLDTSFSIIHQIHAHNLPILLVLNKIDLITPAQLSERIMEIKKQYPDIPLIQISARNKTGFDSLASKILEYKHSLQGNPSTPVWHQYLKKRS